MEPRKPPLTERRPNGRPPPPGGAASRLPRPGAKRSLDRENGPPPHQKRPRGPRTTPGAAASSMPAPPGPKIPKKPTARPGPASIRGVPATKRTAAAAATPGAGRVPGRPAALRAELAACRARAEALDAERDALLGRLAGAEERARAQEDRALRLEEERRDLAARLDARQARLSAAEAALARSLEEAAGLRAERAAQGERLHGLEMERRRLHDQVQDLKGNVRVFCRVRPGPAGEPGPLTFPAGPGPGPTRLTLTRPGPPAARHDFRFDRVFPPGSGQEEVFGEVAPLVQSALDGRPVCIFAYGQTGSGKTYTVEGGPEGEAGAEGLIPRAVRHLLGAAGGLRARGWRYAFAAAFLEVYNDAVRDLLAEGPAGPCGVRRAGPAGDELAVTDARRVPVDSLEEVEELLRRARARRAVARTSRNARSSRSHGLFQLHIAGDHPARGIRTRATLSLVDLAGSERLRDGDGGDGERLRETQAINSSLSALGLVITALANKEPHVPYRNSKLTYLLQSCLSGSAKTLMFVNISPLEENLSESLNSLRFAAKVNQCVIGRAQTNRK
ncbi:kinesin-like protein KIFC1 [Ornithorhynchus anatinus]|uniref:kinesin-like protein KIFC1 n=1 Tax=Ornithorhynchus anatinus TaxID=9258 RepID=UPI0010A8CAF7|nr:kinesin-like protein KIFC1 [Ornithorhynchus anatinus]